MSGKLIFILGVIIAVIIVFVPIYPIEVSVPYNVTVAYNVTTPTEVLVPVPVNTNVLMAWEGYTPIDHYEDAWPFDVLAGEELSCSITTYPYRAIAPPGLLLFWVTFEKSSDLAHELQTGLEPTSYNEFLEFNYNVTLSYTAETDGRIFLVLENTDDWQNHFNNINVTSSRWRMKNRDTIETVYVEETRYRVETRFNVTVVKVPLIEIIIQWARNQGYM